MSMLNRCVENYPFRTMTEELAEEKKLFGEWDYFNIKDSVISSIECLKNWSYYEDLKTIKNICINKKIIKFR